MIFPEYWEEHLHLLRPQVVPDTLSACGLSLLKYIELRFHFEKRLTDVQAKLCRIVVNRTDACDT
jgi:hypothetical protein